MSEAAYKKELDVVAAEVYEAIYIHHIMEEINKTRLRCHERSIRSLSRPS
jgi:hypothetical protein